MERTTRRKRPSAAGLLLAVGVLAGGVSPAAECDASYRIDLVAESGELAVRALVTSPDAVYGGSLGIGYDPSLIIPLAAEPLEALRAVRGGEGPQFLDVKLQVETDGSPFRGGMTVQWIDAVPLRRGDALPAGTRVPILRFTFRQSPSGLHGRTAVLDPTDTLSDGSARVPISLTIWPEAEPRSQLVRPCTRPAVLEIPCDFSLKALRSARSRFLQRVAMRAAEPVYAGMFGIGYDAAILRVESAVLGADFEVLNSGKGPELFVIDMEADPALCEGPWSAGIVCGWINNMRTPPQPIPPGDGIECLRIQFRARGGTVPGQSSPVDLVDCLRTGLREDPTTVTISLIDRPVIPCVEGGRIEIPAPLPFTRGESNGDRRIDIADAVTALTCLFTWSRCPSCLDVLDTDDNGLVDLGDAIGLLSFLFSSGPPPAPPFPGCGFDPTADGLLCEDGPTGCP